MANVVYETAGPIGDTEMLSMPVADVDAALGWYESKLGFHLISRGNEPKSVRIGRDGVEFGLAENGGDPEQASCYIGVSDVDAARDELVGAGLSPGEIRVDQYDGSSYRVFFLRDTDGLCFCFTKKAAT